MNQRPHVSIRFAIVATAVLSLVQLGVVASACGGTGSAAGSVRNSSDQGASGSTADAMGTGALIELCGDDVGCGDDSDCPTQAPQCLAPEQRMTCGPQPPASEPCPVGAHASGCGGGCARDCATDDDCVDGMSCRGSRCISPRRCYGAPDDVS